MFKRYSLLEFEDFMENKKISAFVDKVGGHQLTVEQLLLLSHVGQCYSPLPHVYVEDVARSINMTVSQLMPVVRELMPFKGGKVYIVEYDDHRGRQCLSLSSLGSEVVNGLKNELPLSHSNIIHSAGLIKGGLEELEVGENKPAFEHLKQVVMKGFHPDAIELLGLDDDPNAEKKLGFSRSYFKALISSTDLDQIAPVYERQTKTNLEQLSDALYLLMNARSHSEGVDALKPIHDRMLKENSSREYIAHIQGLERESGMCFHRVFLDREGENSYFANLALQLARTILHHP